ncbi:MAG: UbiA prenyltransferase family protein [Nitrospirota bacterium]
MKNQVANNTSGFPVIKPYVQIARPDHWFKNVFMLPGVVFAIYDSPRLLSWKIIPSFFLGLLSTCLVASSNYTINEIIDAPHDSLHPIKKNRPIPSGKVNLKIAYVEWLVLGIAGITLAWRVNFFFFLSILFLWVMGFIYNIPPVRLKDIPYFDVLSESINNPIRLFLGWFTVNSAYFPTLSLIMAYWMIGAFFMAIKRYAEYRRIGNPLVAVQYRKSFSYYNEYRLILSIVYYASAFSLFFGIFLVRYRIELILSVPFLAGFIPMYLRLGLWEDSPAQYPERLYKQRGLIIYSSFCLIFILCLLFIDIPIVGRLFRPFHLPGN